MHAGRSPEAAATVRKRIQGGVMVAALQSHVLGKKEMTTTQVTAALGLLRKVVPDLSATTLSGDHDNPLAFDVVDAKASLLRGITPKPTGSGTPSEG